MAVVQVAVDPFLSILRGCSPFLTVYLIGNRFVSICGTSGRGTALQRVPHVTRVARFDGFGICCKNMYELRAIPKNICHMFVAQTDEALN